MHSPEESRKIYTVRFGEKKQEISFPVRYGDEPPPKIRLHHGNSSIAVFIFNKPSDSYIELSNDEVEKFDRALTNGRCKHFDSGGRETGDERFNKQLAKLQKKLKERSNGDQCSYCQQFAGVLNIDVGHSISSDADDEVHCKVDDLKLSEPQVLALGTTSAEISWKESVANNEHMSKCMFELQMSKSKNTSFQNVYSGPEQLFQKTGLLPGTKYYFRLRAIKDSITGPFSSEVCFVTASTAPSTPDTPHVSSKTKSSLLLKWSIKSDNGSPVTSYVLQWDRGDANGQFETIHDGQQKQYKFNHDFPPNTAYRFRVKAINKIGESEFSPVFYYMSSAGAPCTPDPPSLVQATASSIQLSWNKPNDNGAEITEYIIQMDDELQGYGFLTVYRGLEQSCIVRDKLKRNTFYKFRLSAINEQGESKWSDSVSYSTRCQTPGRMLPPSLEGKIHTKSFMVSWVAPSDDGGSDIVSYSLQVNNGKGGVFQEVYNGLDTSFKIQDLLPGYLYKVRVSCSTSEFRSPWSEITDIKTLPVIPDPPSAPRQSKKPQAYAIDLEWDTPSYDGGSKITNYNVQMKETVQEDFRHIYFGSKTCCRATELQPNCRYVFRVRAQNMAGESKFSKSSSLSTGPGPPDAVSQFEVICRSSSAIHVSWKVPLTHGTPVTSYVLQYAKDPNGPFEKVFEGTVNKYDLKKNIFPSTTYFFRVQACSVAGSGPWSDLISCQTSAAPPAKVENLKLIHRSDTSLTIEWEKPDDNGAAILSYNIDVNGYKMLSYEPEMLKNDNGESSNGSDIMTYTISDLQPNTQYRLRVQGVNKSGCGIFSSNVTGTTGKVPPDAPVLHIGNCSYQSVKLRWSFLRSQSEASELTYELQMRSDENSFGTVFKSSATSHKVSKLQEQTTYSFRIRAANEAGYGPYSDIVNCKTAIQPPALIKGMDYTNLSTSAVTLSWKSVPPIQTTDRITYIVLGKENKSTDFKQLFEGKQNSFTLNDVISEKTYSFQVCAVRTLESGEKIQCSFSPVLSLTIPSEVTEIVSNTMANQISKDNDFTKPTELSEKQLTCIVFVGFALIVLLVSLLVSFLVS